VETVDGRATRASLELIAKSRELAGKLGGESVALVMGRDAEAVGETLGRHGAERVVLVDDGRLDDYHSELWSAALVQVLQRLRPHVLALPATARGRDLGPRAAGELELGMTGDCVNLGIDRGGRLVQTKPAYGGNIVSVIMGRTSPQLATVRPRMFEPLEPRDAQAEVRQIDVGALPEGPTRVLERSETDPRPRRLDEADLVVAVGADVDPTALEEAAAGAGAAIGGDRAACAAGRLPWGAEVGLQGRSV